MKAVVLAGGFGTRIQPLTTSIPKPMLPVINIPMMEYNIRKLKDMGIDEFVILLYFQPEVIKDYFEDGSKLGIKIHYVLPDRDFGTAGSVRQAKDFLDTEFIVVSGDLITDFDFRKIIDFHHEKKSPLTIGITRVENPLQFGVVVVDENGRIERFLEKPSWGEVINDMINTGVYVISPEILDFIPSDRSFDFSKDLFPLLMDKGIDLWGYLYDGYWRDVGNIKSYIEVHEDILNGIVDPGYSEQLRVTRVGSGEIHHKANCTIHPSVKVAGRVVLGENVYIGEGVLLENSVVGNNVVIRDNTVIKNSIVWNDVEIGQFCSLNRSVICNNVSIGKRVDIEENCVVSEYCAIGNNAEILKDVIIWPHKYIEDDAVVNRNVIWGDRYRSNLFSMGVIEGTANIELTGDVSSKIAEAFGSIFPMGSKVYVGRDYNKSSRMIKRFIMGGLLSVGINVADMEVVSPNILRYELFKDKESVGGIHVRRSVIKQNKTRISFFTKEGLLLDDNLAKNVEKIYFAEKFRRVSPVRIGNILKVFDVEEDYKKSILEKVDKGVFLNRKPKIVVDLMHGTISSVFPDLLEKLNIKSIIIDGHFKGEQDYITTPEKLEESRDIVSDIVKHLSFDIGFLLYPSGQRLEIIDDEGKVLDYHVALLAIIYAIHLTRKEKTKVFLPPWAPDVLDSNLDNIEIFRGRIMGKNLDFLKNFYMIADTDGHYDFTKFGFHIDSAYAAIKIVEILSMLDKSLSQILKEIPPHFYNRFTVPVPHNKKAFVMKKLSDFARAKNKVTYNSGIKIHLDKNNWIFVIPDDVEDMVRLYVQAVTKEKGYSIVNEYRANIEKWIS